MKLYLTAFFALSLTVAVATAQEQLPASSVAPAKFDAGPFDTIKDRLSYSIGVNFGKSMTESLVELEPDKIMEGFRDALSSQSKLTDDQVRASLIELQRLAVEIKKKNGEEFLAENRNMPGMRAFASGLQFKVLKSGDGPTPAETDKVKTHYVGKLIDGTEFDSSIRRGQPAVFPVKDVIKGWVEALTRMKVGDKWQLVVPPALAYGEHGYPPMIGPHEVLIFELELLGIEK